VSFEIRDESFELRDVSFELRDESLEIRDGETIIRGRRVYCSFCNAWYFSEPDG